MAEKKIDISRKKKPISISAAKVTPKKPAQPLKPAPNPVVPQQTDRSNKAEIRRKVEMLMEHSPKVINQRLLKIMAGHKMISRIAQWQKFVPKRIQSEFKKTSIC